MNRKVKINRIIKPKNSKGMKRNSTSAALCVYHLNSKGTTEFEI